LVVCIDATGLSVARYQGRWSLTPYGRRHSKHWLKLHALIDRDNQAILTWKFTDPHVADTVVLPELVQPLRGQMREVLADAGYLSSNNCWTIRAAGATPLIRPKQTSIRYHRNPTKRSFKTNAAFKDMMEAHATQPDWMHRYFRRNSVESAFAAIKRRVGGVLAAVTAPMLRIEAALKLLAWNLLKLGNTEY
jgi:hypothetical protein